MQRNLRQILRVVGNSKHKRNVEKWVDSVLSSATVTYGRNTTLTSNCRIPFGVIDADFECRPFVLYSEYSNTDYDREITEKEVYTFADLMDSGFIERIHRAYMDNFDSVKDLRLFLDNKQVRFWVENEDLSTSILGVYNELKNPENPPVYAEVYALGFKDSNEVFLYTTDKETLKRKIVELKEMLGNKEWVDSSNRFEYDTENLRVKFGKDLAITTVTSREIEGIEQFEVGILPTYQLGKFSLIYLNAYVDEHKIAEIIPNPQNIANFLINHRNHSVKLTDHLDILFLEVIGGFVNYCSDYGFLVGELLPLLQPMQKGLVKAGKIEEFEA